MVNFHKLEKLRKEKGVSASFLGEAVGHSVYYVNSCRRYNTAVPDDVIKKWAELLNTTVEYLTDATDEPAVPASVVNEEQAKVALFGGADNVTAEQWAEVLRFVDYIKNRGGRND